MRLSWNEIRARAAAFATEWAGEGYEKGQTQLFYRDFFEVFGVPVRPWCMKAGLAGSLICRMAQHAFFLGVWNPVHAVQTSRRRPSPHSAAEVPDHELAGV